MATTDEMMADGAAIVVLLSVISAATAVLHYGGVLWIVIKGLLVLMGGVVAFCVLSYIAGYIYHEVITDMGEWLK